MTQPDELSEWMATWQADDPLPPSTRAEVQQRVARSQRGWLLATIAELVIGVVGLGVTITVGLLADRLVERLAMASLTVVVVATMAAGWWLRRDAWRPAAQSTRAWIEFLLRRAQRRMQMAQLGGIILPLEAAILTPWIISRADWSSNGRAAALLAGFTMLGLLCGVLGAGLFFFYRRARRDRDDLLHLHRELQ
jgi:hypothetical protein